ncbi:MAG: hypothetical protein AMJ54_15210 [Deltaproteobacteria bacterium SG8_13]|nr:MAG: hypothetical protein AMJ54_15210 [Deltaproteobacteria bacterium SG8_13]
MTQSIRYRFDRIKGIASLEIDTAGPVNAIGAQFIADLAAAAIRAKKDSAAGVIIRSAKPRSFLDGADLVEIRKDPSPLRLELLLRGFHQALDALATGAFPVAAVVVEQTALGGGFELLLWACDRIFATPGSKMGLPEVNVGLFPAAGGLQTLSRLVGFETALEIVMGGKVLPAEHFAASPVVQIVERHQILATTEKWVIDNPHVINRNIDTGEPPAIDPHQCRTLIQRARKTYTVCPQRPYYEAALAAAEQAIELPFRQAVESQVNHFAPLIADAGVTNKIDFFFTVNAVAPRLLPADLQGALPVDRVAVIGAGLMGRGIAQVCADRDLPVLLFDVDGPSSAKAKQAIADGLDPLVRKGRWPAARRKRLLDNIEPTADYRRLVDVPLVIESVFEALDLKRQVLQKVQSVNPRAVFATNTSALPITDISAVAPKPEQVVGMHYFSPAALMPLLEVVRGPHTSQAALATAVACGQRQQKTCIVVGDGPGFYTSRTFGVYVLTGFYLAEMGIDPWEVDRLALRAGFPQGPLHVYGTAGGTVIHDAAGFLQSRRPELFSLPKTLTRMVAAGYVGAGKPCFYKNGRQPDESARQFVTKAKKQKAPDPDAAAEMLLLSMVNQAFWCLDEGVLQDYFTMDIGAVLGIGFPDFLHGPARYVSQLGVNRTRQRLLEVHQATGLPFFKPAREFDRLVACGGDGNLV